MTFPPLTLQLYTLEPKIREVDSNVHIFSQKCTPLVKIEKKYAHPDPPIQIWIRECKVPKVRGPGLHKGLNNVAVLTPSKKAV